LDAERRYRPEFLGLNLGDVNNFLGGTGGQQGLYGLSRIAGQEAGANIADARASELASMTGQAGAFRGFAQQLSPESQAQVDASAQEAARATQAARNLTPEEQRMSDQSSREAMASRGMLNSNSAIASEVMGRSGVMSQKRQEAAGARSNAFGMAQDFYSAPGLQALGNAPLSYQAGQQQLQMGLGAIGSATPQMINPDAGANLGMQQRSMQTQANIANQSAKASHSAGIFSALGSIGGAAIGAGMFSDKRLKTDIKKVGKTDKGLPVYTYKYKGSDTAQMGVMAQDVEKKTPSAVKTVGGFKALDYSKVK
jgi:hypothetical protein